MPQSYIRIETLDWELVIDFNGVEPHTYLENADQTVTHHKLKEDLTETQIDALKHLEKQIRIIQQDILDILLD